MTQHPSWRSRPDGAFERRDQCTEVSEGRRDDTMANHKVRYGGWRRKSSPSRGPGATSAQTGKVPAGAASGGGCASRASPNSSLAWRARKGRIRRVDPADRADHWPRRQVRKARIGCCQTTSPGAGAEGAEGVPGKGQAAKASTIASVTQTDPPSTPSDALE